MIVRDTLATGPTVAYTDTGGDGPAIVFSHGFLLDRRMFDAQIETLRRDYRCIAWDGRGHGETRFDGAPFSYWDAAADALALLDHLGIAHAVFAGMSQGGFLSLRAALLRPDRVDALVLIDSQAGLEDPEAAPLYEAMFQAWSTQGLDDALAAAAFSLIASPERRLWERFAESARAMPADQLSAPFRCLMDRDDLSGRLAEITAPALVVHGTDDAAIPVVRARQLAGGLPGSSGVHLIDHGAHASNLSHPEAVTAAIAGFLQSLDLPRR